MHSARDRREHAECLETIAEAATALDLSDEPRAVAEDLFLSDVPEADRSKPAAIAASVYAAALIAGEERPQTRVAEVVGVSRIALQQRWRDRLTAAGMEPPGW